MDPISILSAIKLGVSSGRALSSLSKEIGQFFDATDNAKKKLQKKGVTTSDTNSIAYERWSAEIQAAQAEQDLKEWVCDVRQSGLGPSHWNTLLKIRREVLAEKREAERLAKREAQERADLALTLTSIILLILASFIGSTAWLHHKGWVNIWDYLP
jgi:hypothetical protein